MIGSLSETDWQKFVDAQNKPRDTVAGSAASTLMETAKRHMQSAGIDPSPKEGSDDAKKVAEMQSQLLMWQDRYIADKGVAPSKTEIDDQVKRMLAPVVINPGGIWNQKSVTAFEAATLDLSPGDLSGADVTIDGVAYPSDRVKEAVSALEQVGVPVTAESVVEILRSVTR